MEPKGSPSEDYSTSASPLPVSQRNRLSEDDYGDLYALLKAEHGLPNPDSLTLEPLAASHLPATIQPGQNIILEGVGNLTNVNRIASDQELEFSAIGISIIYGGNGSGKSGYVRVMKQACRSRDQLERVYPNANDSSSTLKTPTAKFKIEKDGSTLEIRWEQDCVTNDLLSSISVFDSRCARSYLTSEQDVAYLPYGLDIVENMASEVIPVLKNRLLAEIKAIDINVCAFDHLSGENSVGALVSTISARTDPETVEALGTLSQEEEKRITELDKALSETDPITKAGDIKHFVSRLKTLAKNVKNVNQEVNVDAVKRLKELDDEVVEAEIAEKNSALALQSGKELLPGTGEFLWKALFEAARKYSTEAAYPDHTFPHSSDDALCPLCQTPLDESGERLKRFEKYIKDDVSKTADNKRKCLVAMRKQIENVNLVMELSPELSNEINQFNGDIVQVIKQYQVSINEMRQWMLVALDNHGWDTPPDLAGSPYLKLRRLAAQKLIEARTFMQVADEGHKKKLEREYDELIARQNLQKSLRAVLDLIQRMKKVAALKKCERDLKTKPISDKSKEFASEIVTKELKAALDIEFDNLGVKHIKTKLKERNIKGRILHQLLLEIPSNHNIDEILSEGEQRAIALGAFLAELSLADHSGGIVFDDPVSSLDHWRRQNVARRLVQEAKKRQVIVFTHDTSFLSQLRDEIDSKRLDYKICFLEWKDQYAGNVYDGLPWGHSSYKERIDSLEKMHKKLVKIPWPIYPSESDADKIFRVYNRMRASIERVIQDVVFNGVIKRYGDWISISKLKGVVGFNNAECGEIDRLYQRCNDLIDAHDPSSAKNATVPHVNELGRDIDDLKVVIKNILDRRKSP